MMTHTKFHNAFIKYAILQQNSTSLTLKMDDMGNLGISVCCTVWANRSRKSDNLSRTSSKKSFLFLLLFFFVKSLWWKILRWEMTTQGAIEVKQSEEKIIYFLSITVLLGEMSVFSLIPWTNTSWVNPGVFVSPVRVRRIIRACRCVCVCVCFGISEMSWHDREFSLPPSPPPAGTDRR